MMSFLLGIGNEARAGPNRSLPSGSEEVARNLRHLLLGRMVPFAGILAVTLGLTGLLGLRLGAAGSSCLFEFALGLGAILFAALSIVTEYCLLADWVKGNAAKALYAFGARDCAAGPYLGWLLTSQLTAEAVADQPAHALLALTVRQRETVRDLVARELLVKPALSGPQSPSNMDLLAMHPEASVLTRIDLVCQGLPPAPEAAFDDLMPGSLWPVAIQSLLRSRSVAARLAGLRYSGIPRDLLLRLAAKESEPEVRRTVLAQLLPLLTGAECRKLQDSSFEDVREAIVRSQAIPRGALIWRCSRDGSATIRRLAWERVSNTLRRSEAHFLSTSPYVDIRLCAVRSGYLSRRRVIRLASNDPVSDLRQSAWTLLRVELSPVEAERLSRSRYSDVRTNVVGLGMLPRQRLVAVAAADDERTVREMARGLLEDGLNDVEASILSLSNHPDTRQFAVSSGLLSRHNLVRLGRLDPDQPVRAMSHQFLRNDHTSAAAQELSLSKYDDARHEAIRSGRLSRMRIFSLCARDAEPGVRMASWERLRANLTPAEASSLSRSKHPEVQLWAIQSDMLSRRRLRYLRLRCLFKRSRSELQEATRDRLKNSAPHRSEGDRKRRTQGKDRVKER